MLKKRVAVRGKWNDFVVHFLCAESIAHSCQARNLFIKCLNFINEVDIAEHVMSEQLVGENENPLAVLANIFTHKQTPSNLRKKISHIAT